MTPPPPDRVRSPADDPAPRRGASLRAEAARRAAVLLLIAIGVLLRPLAAASPPDPTWIAGVYDDGDLDNVVALASSLVALAGDPDAARPRPDLDAEPLAVRPGAAVGSAGPLTLLDRSPPRA